MEWLSLGVQLYIQFKVANFKVDSLGSKVKVQNLNSGLFDKNSKNN
jgi:hypothetical protein